MEPSTGPKISIKLAWGGRIVRTFSCGDKVRVLFALVQEERKRDKQNLDRAFNLFTSMPRMELSAHLDDTIDECKLGGMQVLMGWV